MLRSWCAVILIPLSIEPWHIVSELVYRIDHNRDKWDRFATGFTCSLFADLFQALHAFCIGNCTADSFSARSSQIKDTDTCNRFDTEFGLSRVDRISPTCTYSQRSNAVFIHVGKITEIIDRAVDIFDAGGRIFYQARFSATFSLMRSVIGQRDESLFGELLRVQPGGLLFDATKRVNDDNGRILLALVEVGGLNRFPTTVIVLFGNETFSTVTP